MITILTEFAVESRQEKLKKADYLQGNWESP
jgi:hypothetical protein